jgi:predicted transcriptional regulator
LRLSKEEKLAREERIWDLRLRGYTQMTIAVRLGVHQSCVCRTLRRVSTRVARQMHQEIAQRKAEQVAQLEHMAQEAMEAWERSKHAATVMQKQTVGGEDTIIAHVTAEVGDPRFLQAAIAALADIRKVLDMDKVLLVGDGGTLVVQQTHNHVLIIAPQRGRSLETLMSRRNPHALSGGADAV